MTVNTRKNRRPEKAAISAERELRRRKVSANLLAGLTYRDIAEGLGVSLGTVAKDADLILTRWKEESVNDLGEKVRLDARRLDVLLHALWPAATAGDQSAIDRVLKILERKAKLLGLDGLPMQDAATQQEQGKLREFLALMQNGGEPA